jgi:wyosine [tRNA(Phe)-imidazoG37] synthetase (radical SAM superfamily)
MPVYVFGPVPSRRLGRSLGVDLVPMKTCAMNCVYCQLGRTADPNIQLGEFAPVEEVLAQVKAKLDDGAQPDTITISGSGEPTLHSRIAEIIAGIQALTKVPVAVMTHGSLFPSAQVRRNCLKADIILPSLDAGDEETFRRINRPHSSITLANLVEGLVALRREYHGQIWLEVFLLEGYNAEPSHCEKMKLLIDRINPDKIHLNTAVRPTTEPGIGALPREKMLELAKVFGSKAEVVAEYSREPLKGSGKVTPEAIHEMLNRRPCSLDDVAAGLNADKHEVQQALEFLVKQGQIEKSGQAGKVFYKAVV